MLSDATFSYMIVSPLSSTSTIEQATPPGISRGRWGLAGALVEEDFLGFLVVGEALGLHVLAEL